MQLINLLGLFLEKLLVMKVEKQASQQTLTKNLNDSCTANIAGYVTYYFPPKSQWIIFRTVQHGEKLVLVHTSKHLSVNLI